MEVARVFAKRSTCLRGRVGAVLVADGRIIATGYNGAPPGLPQCDEVGCDSLVLWKWEGPTTTARLPEQVELGCQRAVHAEANVIAFAARYGIRTGGATLYCTHGPCLKCAQLIVSAGIKHVVYETPYRLHEGLILLEDAHVTYDEWRHE